MSEVAAYGTVLRESAASVAHAAAFAVVEHGVTVASADYYFGPAPRMRSTSTVGCAGAVSPRQAMCWSGRTRIRRRP